MKLGTTLFLLFIYFGAFAQGDTAKKLNPVFYAELYYSYDFSKPSNGEKPAFIYNHKRHNEVSTNLILIKAAYLTKNYRANAGLMTGNYAQYNLRAEPALAQLVYEANAGIKLIRKHSVWLDAGIMPSHIGFESAIGADCRTLTRSLLAENSPYYETGVKLSYTSKDDQLNIAALYLNGWQRIRRPDGYKKPSFGLQINYKPSDKLLINYSNFLGTDKPDSVHSFRHFHNFFLQYDPVETFGITAGFDIGFEKMPDGKFANWYSPVVILQQSVAPKINVALRGEYYHDRQEIMIPTETMNGFRLLGLSFNTDYKINSKMKCRAEAKLYHSKDKIFSNATSRDNYSLTSAFTVKL